MSGCHRAAAGTPYAFSADDTSAAAVDRPARPLGLTPNEVFVVAAFYPRLRPESALVPTV